MPDVWGAKASVGKVDCIAGCNVGPVGHEVGFWSYCCFGNNVDIEILGFGIAVAVHVGNCEFYVVLTYMRICDRGGAFVGRCRWHSAFESPLVRCERSVLGYACELHDAIGWDCRVVGSEVCDWRFGVGKHCDTFGHDFGVYHCTVLDFKDYRIHAGMVVAYILRVLLG